MLDDGSEESLTEVGMDAVSGRFYCAVRGGRARAVLSRAAHQALIEHVEQEDGALLPLRRPAPAGLAHLEPRRGAHAPGSRRPRRPRPAARARGGIRPRRSRPRRRPRRAALLRRMGGPRPRRRDALPHRAGGEARRSAGRLPLGAVGGVRGPAVRHPRAVLDRRARGSGLDQPLRLGRRLPRRDGRDARAVWLPRCGPKRGPSSAGAYVDTGPVVERAFAAAAGLGAWGKNTCLLHPEHGSWFFLGELVTDLDLAAPIPRAPTCAGAAPPASTLAPRGPSPRRSSSTRPAASAT